VFSREDQVISPPFFQFLVLVWDGLPSSHSIFISSGVPGFLHNRLLQSRALTLPHSSLGLLARRACESEYAFPFPPAKLFDCLGWEETEPDAAFAMAGFCIDREAPGWDEYLSDCALATLGRSLIDGSSPLTRWR
jgi:hypothetical protein